MTNHCTLDQLDAFPWIVSCDTLKAEDLLPKFWTAAEGLAVLLDRPQLLNPATLASLTKLVGEDSKEADWDDTEAAQTLEDLHEALSEVAPTGFYFGSQEGDGACFGFWLDQEWADVLEHCGWAADSDSAALADVIRELEQDGIDCENFEDAYCGEAEGYSEEAAGADYAQQLAEEQGLMPSAPGWPFSCIDWADAWRELELGDGFRVHRISGNTWAVFRSV
jgi:hypothetical protein